jgi:hypothetical protein
MPTQRIDVSRFDPRSPAFKQPFLATIEEGLKRLRTAPDAMERDSRFPCQPRYVVDMGERVLEVIHSVGRTDVTLEDVMRKELMASGHSDYHSKFALYCTELSRPFPTPPTPQT